MNEISSADEINLHCGRKKFRLWTKKISSADEIHVICTVEMERAGEGGLLPDAPAAYELDTINFSEPVGFDLKTEVEAVAGEGERIAESDMLVEPTLFLLARIAQTLEDVPTQAHVERHLAVEDFVAQRQPQHVGRIAVAWRMRLATGLERFVKFANAIDVVEVGVVEAETRGMEQVPSPHGGNHDGGKGIDGVAAGVIDLETVNERPHAHADCGIDVEGSRPTPDPSLK